MKQWIFKKVVFCLVVFLLPFQVVLATTVVNDPGFTLNAQDIDKQWGVFKSRFPEVWSLSNGESSNVVAIIDTGVDQLHEDLQNITFLEGYDFVSNSRILPRSNSDDNGHGTLVAGVLGATPNNGLGIAGTNWKISIMPIKVLDSAGKGDVKNVAAGIVWATDHGANFINLSMGGASSGRDDSLAQAVRYAFSKNVLIVAAAGNDTGLTGKNLDEFPVYPICDDNGENMILGVSAVDQNDKKPTFSNYGKNCVDVVAPGKRILSTINYDPLTKVYSPNSYAYASGSSMAVPFVVGQAALIKSVYPFATAKQIRDRIIATSESVDAENPSACGGGSCKGLLGAGRINVQKSIQTAFFSDKAPQEGDLFKSENTPQLYVFSSGRKMPISIWVMHNRYSSKTVKVFSDSQVAEISEGPYIAPLDGSLVKQDSDPTVYYVEKGKKYAVTGTIFRHWGFKFTDIKIAENREISSWPTAGLLPPKEGTVIKVLNSDQMYWVVGQSLRPLSRQSFLARGLELFPVLKIEKKQLDGYTIGQPI